MPKQINYLQFPLYCPICKKITIIKKYKSPYALLYHLNSHNKQDEIESSIEINEIKKIARSIAKAVDSGMLSIKKYGRVE